MTVRIIRLRSLYNIPARAAQPACAGKPAVKARPFRRGIFDAGKTWVFENLILRNPDQPLIPGTNVRRLETFGLGKKNEATTDDEARHMRFLRPSQLYVASGRAGTLCRSSRAVLRGGHGLGAA
jgi:hypothetical protein